MPPSAPASEVHTGDATEILPSVVAPGTVDLVYLDPPFMTGNTRRGRDRHTGVTRSFEDRWPDMAAYLGWLRGLLEASVATLSPAGAVLVHCDWRANHHIRVLLDEILGPDAFRNEIIWHYRRWTAAKGSLQRLHQTIWYYAASPAHRPSVPVVEYSPTTNLDQIWQARTRNADDTVVYDRVAGTPRNNGAKRGVPLGDVWDIPYLNPKARERVGYPTQKPVALLERLISIACPEGGVVLDPCCGSGTTLVAAALLGRRSIGIDVSPSATALARERLAAPRRSDSRVLATGREAFRRPAPGAAVADTLSLLQAHAVQRNRLIDGYLSPAGLDALGLPVAWSVPVRVALEGEDLGALATAFSAVVRDKACAAGLLLADGVPAWRADPPVVVGPCLRTPADVEEARRRLPACLSG